MKFKIILLISAFLGVFHISNAQKKWQIIQQELIMDVPPFRQCHASTVAETASGKIMAAWFGGTREGNKDVCIWISERDKTGWSKPYIVADGIIVDTLRYPCWNPVLFNYGKKVFLYYKIGPTTRKWWPEVIYSEDDGKTWSPSSKITKGATGPAKNKPIQLADGSILSPASTQHNDIWKTQVEKSVDGGKSWRVIPVDSASSYEVIQPSILTYPNKKMQILCRSKQDSIVEAWSYDNGETWSKLQATKLFNPNSGTDAVTLNDGTQMLIYNPMKRGKEWYNGREKLNVAISKDGKNWEDVIVLEDGIVTNKFSYPAIIQGKDGKVHITYTYNRKNIKYVVIDNK